MFVVSKASSRLLCSHFHEYYQEILLNMQFKLFSS